ncbi:hypothetical protein [Actinomadura madurae]|uniref:hypothetical protein n=1 Tax=Actinomadura madurae TaxID=1993 RepID=UPI003556C2CF
MAEEKVHGAHFALVSNGRTARAAGRRGPLDEDRLEAFFGVTRLWPVLATAAAAAARAVGQDVVLYGELAAGAIRIRRYRRSRTSAQCRPGFGTALTWYGWRSTAPSTPPRDRAG